MSINRIVFTAIAMLVAVLAAQADGGIVIRHDREDARYLELGARFPAVGLVGRDGGTLIAPQWVMTAAHVAQSAQRHGRKVRLAEVDYAIDQVFTHPDWREQGPHDLALIKLTAPVKGVTPIDIYSGHNEAGKIATFVGQGGTGTGLTGPTREDGKKRGATNKIDSADQDWLHFTFDDPATATDLEGISGPGDSGGPALIEMDGTFYLAGVSVWGMPGKNGRGTYGAKEGYTRVSTHDKWIEAILAGKKAASSATASAQSSGAPTLPETQAGQRVAAYIKAFNSGDEQTMREFFTNHLAPDSLARRSMDERMQVYRQMRGEMGTLELQRVVEAKESAIATLVKTNKGEWFNLGFEFEPQSPHKLLGLGVENTDPPKDNAPPANSHAPAPKTEAELVAALEQHLNQLVKADEFSGTVLLAKNGKPVFQKAYGLASKEYNVANRTDTKFNLGSINKIFTQVAIGQLVERGKLSLDDPIIKYLPDYPNRQAAEKVTIRQLLQHSSGVGDFFNEKYEATPKNKMRSIADFVALVADEPLAFEPGTKRQYSNGGYAVLGAIIEKAAGQDYYTYVREQIFKPAGMENTDYYEADVPIPNLAMGYTRRSGESGNARRNNIYTRPARGSSAGGGYSTVEDMLKFTLALQNRKLLANKETGGMMAGDGLGIAGGAPGINAVVEVDSGYTIIAMSNYDPPSAVDIGKKVREWLAGLKK
jgi:CubicO group peptidase (beta-lactamase class C family)